MKSVCATIGLLAVCAAGAVAQMPAPMPAPVPAPPSFPLVVPPPTSSPATHDSSPFEGPTSGSTTLRVPRSFSAPYNSPYAATEGYVDPRGLSRLGGAPGGCATCSPGGGCFVCGPAGKIWGEIDYILWQASGDAVPALVTTSPTGTAVGAAGVLGSTGTRVLAGSSKFSDDLRSGLRYNVGVWLNPEQTIGVQTGGFFLQDGSSSAAFSSAGDPILARPFTNALNGAASSQLIAYPGVVGGAIGVDHSNRIYGFDAALRGNMCCTATWRLDALLGYRFLRIEDNLDINETLTAGAGAPANIGVPVGTNVSVADRFQTSNTFNGVQAGVTGEWRFADHWFISGTGKASFGWMNQVININGATAILVPGGASTQYVGGLLALSSNMGRSSQTDAVIIPELNVNLGYQLTSNIRLRAGYSFLYVSSVTRPGSVMDTTVNPALIPPATGATPARPTTLADHNDLFLQGINAGIEVRY